LATLKTSVLLATTGKPRTIRRGLIDAFPWERWLSERAAIT